MSRTLILFFAIFGSCLSVPAQVAPEAQTLVPGQPVERSVEFSRSNRRTPCNLFKRLVPRVGVEPTRPYGQRILRTLEGAPRSLTKRYEPVFTRLAVVKVSLRLATYQHVRSPSWPHLSSSLDEMKNVFFRVSTPQTHHQDNNITNALPVRPKQSPDVRSLARV